MCKSVFYQNGGSRRGYVNQVFTRQKDISYTEITEISGKYQEFFMMPMQKDVFLLIFFFFFFFFFLSFEALCEHKLPISIYK